MKLKAVRWLFIVFAFSFSNQLFAQSKAEEKLAIKYFNNAEYDKCLEIFEDLYKSGKRPTYYFNYLLDSYLGLNQYDQAEKLAKKFSKRYKGNPIYLLDLAKVYEASEQPEEAHKVYQKAIEKALVNNSLTSQLGSKLEQKERFNLALTLYTEFEKKSPSTNGRYRIARLYGRKGAMDKMYDILISELEKDPVALAPVKGYLRNIITEDAESDNNQILKGILIKKLQRNAPHQVLDLLIWQFIQEKNFAEALVQEMAFDKRNPNEGSRIMNLAGFASNNKDWETTRKALNYVISLGEEGMYYYHAQEKLLTVQNVIIQNSANVSQEDILDLDKSYKWFFDYYKKGPRTQLLLKDYGLFTSHFMKDSEKAESILKEAVEINGGRKEVAECKLAYADILLFNNEIWDALLYYNQVDKDFKHDILGSEARFRKAKVAFYQNDFEWAKAQLDILRSSTERLIANNAMDLSLLIQENLNMDSIYTALSMYATAELLAYQNRDKESDALLDSLITLFPEHILIDDCYYLKAKNAFKNRDFEKQIHLLEWIVENYPYDLYADNALFDLGITYRDYSNEMEKSKKAFQMIFLEYPSSYFASSARKHYRELKKRYPDKKAELNLENAN